MAVIDLTEARIRALELGSGIWRDEQAKGLMVVCYRTTKTYAVQGDVRRNGRHVRTVRIKIDRCDRIGLREARRRARELMSQIQSGVDPTAAPKPSAMTVAEALEAHLTDRDLRPRTVESYREHVDGYLKSLRSRAVADVTRQDVRDLMDEIIRKHGRTAAASALRTLRALINTAMRVDEQIKSNPMVAVMVPVPKARKVDPIDLADWWDRTGSLSEWRRDLHRAFLLTGARRSSLLQVKRDHVDIGKATITFKHMKTGGEMTYPMGTFLTEMIGQRLEKDAALRSEWLWPSPTSECGHIVEPKENKNGLRSAHEYRHLNRTLAIAAGVPYAESALLLGQRLPGASGGYVHPEHLVEHLRPHAQRIEDLIIRPRETSQR